MGGPSGVGAGMGGGSPHVYAQYQPSSHHFSHASLPRTPSRTSMTSVTSPLSSFRNPSGEGQSSSPHSSPATLRRQARQACEPLCIGEAAVHTGAVHGLLSLGPGRGVISCGADGTVVLWRDSHTEAVRRAQVSLAILQHERCHDEAL
eukprot:m.497199 g.497199  ORF g.497199 m.497199 type:complete len:148 (-) comp50304_c0_seq1:115-558(-)